MVSLPKEEEDVASAGNRTRGWPSRQTSKHLMATANFTTKPPMLCMTLRTRSIVYGVNSVNEVVSNKDDPGLRREGSCSYLAVAGPRTA